METSFRASVASMGGFSSGLEKAKAESKLFSDQLALQKRATEQLRAAMDGARAKLTADAQAYQAQAQKVEGLRAKQAGLKDEITNLKSAMDQSKAATGDNTEEYISMSLRLDELNAALKENEKDLKAQEAQLRKNDAAVASAERTVQASTRSYNEARIVQGDIQKALDATNKRLKNHVAQLEDASKKMKAYGDRTREIGQAQSKIGQGLTVGVTTPVMAGLGASAGAAIGWESAYAGVRKTVSGTPEELQRINEALIDMSKNIPATAEDLAGIAANAGQLGIATNSVTEFTRTIADLKETTNLTAEQGAQDFAKFANITKMPQTEFSNMGSAVVALGNNLATTESDTVALAMNLASAASQAKMTQAETLGIAAALSSLGLEAQAGGTAFSKTITQMQVAVETGSKDVKDYAKIAGMSAAEFATAFKTDAAGALTSFIAGLSSGTDSAVVMLDKMGVTETRMRDALLRASGAGDLLTSSIKLSTDAWRENTALANEANVRYQTTASRMQTLKNQTTAAAITLGNDLLPMINEGITSAGEWVEKFNNLDEATRKNILTFAGWAAAAGPAILLVGKGNEAVGAVATGLSKFTGAMAAAGGGVSGFTSALGGLLGPVGVVALGAALLVGAAKWYDYASGAKAAREATEAMIETAKKWKDTQASTIYDTGSDPFARFGLEKSDFGGGVDESRSWIDRLNQTWTDGKTETKQTVADYVNEFKAGSDKVREAIEARKATQKKYGVTGDQATEDDLKKLKAYDREVEALLKKKRGGKLTADDQQRLETIVQERVQIQLKYTTGDGGGYDSIAQAVEAEKARLASEGQTAGSDLYADALSAGAQGYQTQVDAINQSYRDQYADIQAITDEKAREAAMEQLNLTHQQSLNAARAEYNKLVSGYAPEAFQTPEIQEAQTQMEKLKELVAQYNAGEIDETKLKAFTDTLDEGKLASYMALLAQIQEGGLGGLNLGTEEAPIKASDLLDGYNTIGEFLEANKGTLPGLADMFGAAGEEAQRVLVDLELSDGAKTLKEQLEAWEASGIDVTVTGTLTGVDGAGKAFMVTNATVNADGTLTGVDGEGNTFTATNYMAHADGTLTGVDGNGNTFSVTGATVTVPGTLTAVDGEGKTFNVTNANVNAEGTLTGVDGDGKAFTATNCTVNAAGVLSGVDGNGKTFTATGATVTVAATLSGVTGEGKAFRVTNATVSADGILTGVDGEGKTFVATNCVVNADGTLSGVTGDGKTFTVSGATVNVPGTLSSVSGGGKTFSVTDAKVNVTASYDLSGIDQAAIDAYYNQNPDRKPGVTMEVGLKAGWGNLIRQAYDSGTLEAFGADGAQLSVTPQLAAHISPTDIIAYKTGDNGEITTDGNGNPVISVIIVPKLGTKEAADLAGDKLGKKPESPLPDVLTDYSAGDKVDAINGMADAADKLAKAGEGGEAQNAVFGPGGVIEQLGALNASDLTNVADALATATAALASGTLSEEDAAKYQERVDAILKLIQLSDTYLGVGNDVSAGIAGGMVAYGWDGDAATLATNLETALRSAGALNSQSPAQRMVPLGGDVAAGIGQGLAAYPFTTEASTAALTVKAAVEAALAENPISFAAQITLSGIAQIKADIASQFGTLKTDGEGYGKNLMDGIIKGLGDKEDDAKKKAKGIADDIREIIRKAWDINSPSKEGAWLGGMLIEGIGVGMDRRIPDVVGRLNRLELRAAQAGRKSQVIHNNQKSGDIVFNGPLEIRDKQDIRALAIEINQQKVNSERALGAVYHE